MTSNGGVDEAPFHDPKKIVRLRILAGRSQAAVARGAKISAPYLCDIEKGKTKNPSPEVLARIAEQIGCAVADFERDSIPADVETAEVS